MLRLLQVDYLKNFAWDGVVFGEEIFQEIPYKTLFRISVFRVSDL